MAVAIDAVSTAFVRTAAGQTSYSGSANITVGPSLSNGAMTLLLIFDNQSVTGVTSHWDSAGANQSFVSIISATNATGVITIQLMGLINPTAGNKNLTVNWTGNAELLIFAESWTGVDQTGGATSFAHSTSASTTLAGNATATLTVTSATGNAVLAGWANDFNWASVNNTQLFLDNTGANLETASNRASGAASVGMTATNGGTAVNYAAVAADIVAASGAAAYVPYNPWPQAAPILGT